MKIGIDARFFGPENKGLGRYTQKLITHLERIDHNNKYVIFLRRENFDAYVPQSANFTKICADYRWYSFAEQLFFPFVLYKQKCDFVHFPHFNVPLLYRKKFIMTIHDLILLRYATQRTSTRFALFYWFKFFMYRIVIASAIRRSSLIIAVSHFTKKDICAHYPAACKKVKVVYEAAEIMEKGKKDAAAVLAKYDIMEPYMLYVGNAYLHKNLPFLVDVFAHYKTHGGTVRNLVFIGRDDYFYKQLRTYIKQKKVKGIVIINGVSDEELITFYRRAVAFVFPSLYEGFGLPPLEAQLLGVPVLSSDRACMKEILSPGGAYYADANDVATFARAMETITTDNALRVTLKKKGRENARHFSWQKMAEHTYNLYRKI